MKIIEGVRTFWAPLICSLRMLGYISVKMIGVLQLQCEHLWLLCISQYFFLAGQIPLHRGWCYF